MTIPTTGRAAAPCEMLRRVRLLFVRHGETDWNRAGRYQGRSDPPLSPAGVAMADALAGELAAIPVAAILTSPLRRAAMTAQRIAAVHRLTAQADSRLMELGFGDWEGLTQAEVKARWPALLKQWKTAPQTVRFSGGDSLSAVRERLFTLLNDRAPDDLTVVVTHDAMIRIALLAASGRGFSAFREVSVPTCSVRQMLWRGGEQALVLDSGDPMSLV